MHVFVYICTVNQGRTMKILKPSFEVIEPSFGSSFTYTAMCKMLIFGRMFGITTRRLNWYL